MPHRISMSEDLLDTRGCLTTRSLKFFEGAPASTHTLPQMSTTLQLTIRLQHTAMRAPCLERTAGPTRPPYATRNIAPAGTSSPRRGECPSTRHRTSACCSSRVQARRPSIDPAASHNCTTARIPARRSSSELECTADCSCRHHFVDDVGDLCHRDGRAVFIDFDPQAPT